MGGLILPYGVALPLRNIQFPKFDNLITLSLQLNVDLDYLCGLSNNLKYDMSSLNPNTVSKIDEIIKKDIQKKL